uniref:Si:ch211-215c18.3 n=1 Tax=Amphiprion percula TaxID=161767 RepID=A0A3P8RUK6_AMPPE
MNSECNFLFASLPVNPVSTFLFAPRGPQMFPCLTYLERNVRVDCEFPATYQIPGPYCEYRQDSRLVGSTYPNAVIYVSTEDRRRSNVIELLFGPLFRPQKPAETMSKLTFLSITGILPICSAISVMFKSAPWFLSLVMSLPVAVGLLSP